MHLPAGYTAHHQIPEIDDYRRLRRICGLTPEAPLLPKRSILTIRGVA